MKLNKKGFTLVEILATVAIMAILSGVAVAATTRYLEKTREDSYKAMESAAFAAAQNYIQQRNPIIPVFHEKVSTSTLDDTLYKEKLAEKLRKKGTSDYENIYRLISDFTPAEVLNDDIGVLNNSECPNCFYVLDVDTLVEQEFLDELKDPKASDSTCTGNVYIAKEKSLSQYEYWDPSAKNNTGGYVAFEKGRLDSYVYLVEIECYDYISSHAVMSKGDDNIMNTNDDEKTSKTARGVIFHS